MDKHLKTGLIHLDVQYKNSKQNLQTLLELNEKAAAQGHRIIVNTELGISGYSFESFDEIAPHAEPDNGPTMTGLQAIAKRYGAFICLGFAERDRKTGVFYNSALVIDPAGKIVCRYNKINAETRWACPGDGVQDNIFQTPWGTVGVLICSDTYHGLIPRQTALKGADLIIAPANWPRGGIDPGELWRVRAMENGIYMVVCNRGGKDRTMSCHDAPSCAFDPHGRCLLEQSSSTSATMTVDIPLKNGRLEQAKRLEQLGQRHPERYRPIYLDMRHVTYDGGDYTDYYDMAKPGPYHISCHTSIGNIDEITDIVRGTHPQARNYDQIMGQTIDGEKINLGVFVFPELASQEHAMAIVPVLKRQIEGSKKAVCLGFKDEQKKSRQIFIAPDGMVYHHGNNWAKDPTDKSNSLPGRNRHRTILDIGPIRAGICNADELIHPEVAVAHAKLGCDLLITSAGKIEPSLQTMAAAKTLERITIAVAAHNLGFICQPPESHARWQETLAVSPGVCRQLLNSNDTRSKHFQDRVDFKTLLQTSS